MFSAAHVEELFQASSKTLHRSQLLLEERVRPNCLATSSPTSATSAPGPSPRAQSSAGGGDSLTAVVQALDGLAHFRAFVDTTEELAGRIVLEMKTPSAAIQRQRQKGQPLPILRRVAGGLAVQQYWQALADCPEAQRLWWDGDEEEDASSMSARGGGAYVSALLVAAALYTDSVHGAANALASLGQWAHVVVVQRSNGGGDAQPPLASSSSTGVGELLHEAAKNLPAEVHRWLVGHITSVLGDIRAATAADSMDGSVAPSPLGVLLVPGWAAYAALEGEQLHRVTAPLATLSAGLLPLYLSNEEDYTRSCSLCVLFFAALTTQLMAARTTTASSSDRRAAQLKQILDALLQPIEQTFVASAARPGMALALLEGLLNPLRAVCQALRSKHAECCAAYGEVLLNTAQYRLLLVIENVGRAELGIVSGQAHTTAKQKRYEERLQRSQGKMSLSLLTCVAEDKQLLLEEAGMRSPGGHRVYKIHDGGDDGGVVVLLYVDDGSVYFKVGRAKAFQVASSVDNIFKVFE